MFWAWHGKSGSEPPGRLISLLLEQRGSKVCLDGCDAKWFSRTALDGVGEDQHLMAMLQDSNRHSGSMRSS